MPTANPPGKGSGGFLLAAAFFVAGAMVGGLALHFGFERPALDAAQARLQQYDEENAAVRRRLELAENTAASLEGRLLVEESTRRGLETTLRTLQDELGRAHDTLAFYEQLVPPGPKGVVTIRALDIERAGPHLRYRALLMRSGTNDKAFEGSLQFVAEGVQDGEQVSVTLEPIVVPAADTVTPAQQTAQTEEAEDDAVALAVAFSDFQRSSGLLGLPTGFELGSVTLNVLEGRSLRTSRSVDLSSEP